jgi:hypothetical protein
VAPVVLLLNNTNTVNEYTHLVHHLHLHKMKRERYWLETRTRLVICIGDYNDNKLMKSSPNYSLLQLSLPGHMSSLPSILQGVHVAQSVVLRLVFCTSLFVIWSFFFFLLSVIRFPVSDYPSGIFKLFWHSLGWSDWDPNPWSIPHSLHHRCGYYDKWHISVDIQ